MEKKFIAIIVAFVILVTAVAVGVAISINKKDTYVDPDGIEHWLVKDEEGNTILNGEGDVVVYATDEKGQRQKDENGEYVTAAVDFPEKVIDGNTLETPDYRLTMPKGWNLKDNGQFVLKENSNVQVSVSVSEMETVTTIDDYIADMLDGSDEFLEKVKEKYPAAEKNVGKCVITLKKLDCRTVEYKLAEKEGDTDYYIFGIYFIRGNKAFQISITCFDSSYEEYAKDIDLVAIADSGLVVKEYMSK